MFFPIFTTLGIIIASFSIYMRHSRKNIDAGIKELWKRELEANSVRKQPLTDIVYIEPDFSKLPLNPESPDDPDDNIRDYQKKLLALKDKKIVNLSGISNTDLKLKYGVANLDYLSSCDENFLELVKYLYLWGNALYEQGRIQEAKQVLEYGVSVHSDVKGNYRLLAQIYADEFDFCSIELLSADAEKLTAPTRDSIVKMLKTTDYFHE